MARYSKKKVIKKKSVNKNKNTRVKKRRVSRGKSRRRVKRKYRGGGDGVEYIELKDKKDKKEYYEYAKKLAELIYRVLHRIFILSENTDQTAVLNLLMTRYNVKDTDKLNFFKKLLDIVFESEYKITKKSGGGDLNFKIGSSKNTVTRPTAGGLTDLGFLQEFGIVMAKADAAVLNYFFETEMPCQSVSEILSGESGRPRIISTGPTDVINTFSTFLNNPVELPDGDAGDAGEAGVLAGHILLATKAAIDTVEYNVTNQPGEEINFDLVLNIEDDIDTFLAKMEIINASAREAFKSLVRTL